VRLLYKLQVRRETVFVPSQTHAVPLIWSTPAPPARRALSRQSIVAAAIEVADARGAAALTMAAVADRLGDYTSMSLYRYVQSKEGLVDLMLDTAISEVPLPDPALGWRAALRQLGLDSWEMAHRHLWYAQLVHTRPPLGPNTMRRTESVLRLLVDAGAGVPQALSYLALLDRHVFSAAVVDAEERRMAQTYGIDDADDLVAAIREIHRSLTDPRAYPLLSAWMAAPAGPTTDEQVVQALDFILDGMRRQLHR
jgi:AcrR family transcriptional regulator